MRTWLLAAVVAAAALAGCTGRAPVVTSTAPASGGYLLTELSAEVGRSGVVLSWKVDESRAARITGFTCVYRTPGHLELGVAGAVACGEGLSDPADRGRVVAGLPEYGDYLFEVTAQVSGQPMIEWSLRALQVQLEVTRDLAGPPGPDEAVTGAGPVVTGCGPDDGPGETPSGRPWKRGDIVSAEHLTHYPGRAWAPGGDSQAAVEWPEPTPLSALFDQADLDGDIIGRALDGAGADTGSAGIGSGAGGADSGDGDAVGDAAALLADDRAAVPLQRASAGTKALLRAADGGWDMKLHTSYPFGAYYRYEPAHAVPGWGDPGHPVAGAGLWNRTDCPPPGRPDATHDVALAVSHDAGDRRLEHSGYGWWTVAPVGMFPERVVATKGGLAYGEAADSQPQPPASWRGRVSGHLFWNQQRYGLAADVTLVLAPAGDTAELSGSIDSVVIIPLDHATLEPGAGPPLPWSPLTLGLAEPRGAPDGAGEASAWPGWSGIVTVAEPLPGEAPPPDAEPLPGEAPPPDTFVGDWRARAHGPGAAEITGELRLWTPLAPDGDPDADWPSQVLIVAGFGAARVP
ncbi:hypothetical protein [Candidatus Poriferisodalis sp.]|uniref:hypothetical protein n=1 Tax=Candidatus Poriferisodalis sp. TaxID=3101277 RepID=UPI003B01A88E